MISNAAAIYLVALSFASWDDCQDFLHARGIYDMPQLELACAPMVRENFAPTTSLRPKGRDDD